MERERARGLEREEKVFDEKPSLSGHVQAASCRVEELRPATAADLCLFFPPTPPSRSGWGRGGDVKAPPRPRLPGAEGFLGLQSASQPVAAADAQAAAGSPAAVISLAPAVPTMKYQPLFSPPSLGAQPITGYPRTQHRIRLPGSPVALTSGASKPSWAAFPTPRTAGDALPLLQLKLVATCRLPGFLQGGSAISLYRLTGRLGLCRPPTSGDGIILNTS